MNENGYRAILDQTRAYVRENFLYMRPDYRLEDDDPLLDRGVIDSMGVLELIGFLQREFDITIGDDDIRESNLGTLRSIASYVSRRKNGVLNREQAAQSST